MYMCIYMCVHICIYVYIYICVNLGLLGPDSEMVVCLDPLGQAGHTGGSGFGGCLSHRCHSSCPGLDEYYFEVNASGI